MGWHQNACESWQHRHRATFASISPFLFLHELARTLHVPRDAVSSWVLTRVAFACDLRPNSPLYAARSPLLSSDWAMGGSRQSWGSARFGGTASVESSRAAQSPRNAEMQRGRNYAGHWGTPTFGRQTSCEQRVPAHGNHCKERPRLYLVYRGSATPCSTHLYFVCSTKAHA